jgi:predicted 3-demethylubiquinone-9 3-methyltransferase (glyoxalase superfamily)
MRAPQKITPFLWFDSEAEAAARLYVSLFENSRIHSVSRRGESGPAMSVVFELDGQRLIAFNGGPHFRFNEAVSLFVDCATQDEIDRLWAALIAEGGAPSRCGWLKDRFGLSWQIVPSDLGAMLQDKDPARAQRTMAAMLAMQKLDIAALKRAHAGG